MWRKSLALLSAYGIFEWMCASMRRSAPLKWEKWLKSKKKFNTKEASKKIPKMIKNQNAKIAKTAKNKIKVLYHRKFKKKKAKTLKNYYFKRIQNQYFSFFF